MDHSSSSQNSARSIEVTFPKAKLKGIFDSKNTKQKMELELKCDQAILSGKMKIGKSTSNVQGLLAPEGRVTLNFKMESEVTLNGTFNSQKKIVGSFSKAGSNGDFEIELTDQIFEGIQAPFGI